MGCSSLILAPRFYRTGLSFEPWTKCVPEATTYNIKVTSSVPADRDSLSDQVTRYVIDYIKGSGLGPGEKVPSEIRTSAHLQISRGVVREAYRSLSAAGVLEIANGRVPRVG